jgi:hypothetical protein
MFPKPKKILLRFIVSPLTITFSLNSILIYLFIKDWESRRTLLQGKARGGLYPLPSISLCSSKQVLSSNKYSITRWHARLGHPSSSIVKFVLSKNCLPCSSESSESLVCDACQQVKSHQLPYPKFSSVSKSPLRAYLLQCLRSCL